MPSDEGGATSEARGAMPEAGGAMREAGGAMRDGSQGRGDGAEVAAPKPEPTGEPESPLANSAFAEAPAGQRASNSQGVSGGVSDSGAPPDRAE